MNNTIILFISEFFLLSACGNEDNEKSKEQSNDNKQKEKSGSVKEIDTDKNVQGNNYRTILPFKESKARGLLHDTMAIRYNCDDFDYRLLELCHDDLTI